MPHFISIQNLQDAGLDIYARLSEVQLLRYREPKPGIFIAESPIVVERALAAGYRPISVLMDEAGVPKQQGLLEVCGEIPVYTARFDVLTQITGFKLTRGMLCAMERNELPQADILCRDMYRIAVLEDVMNPTNVGAIFRSAAALGMDAVLLTHGCADPLYRRAIRVSMGTVFQIPWTYLPKSEEDISGGRFYTAIPRNGGRGPDIRRCSGRRRYRPSCRLPWLRARCRYCGRRRSRTAIIR